MKNIRSEAQYEKALAKIEALIDTPEERRDNAELELLTSLVIAYEELHYPIEPPPVIAAVQFRMEQEGLNQADVSRITGISKSRISEILSGKREPSKEHILAFHSRLGIPFHHLLSESREWQEIKMDYVAQVGYPDLSRTHKKTDWQLPWDKNNAARRLFDNFLAEAA